MEKKRENLFLESLQYRIDLPERVVNVLLRFGSSDNDLEMGKKFGNGVFFDWKFVIFEWKSEAKITIFHNFSQEPIWHIFGLL